MWITVMVIVALLLLAGIYLACLDGSYRVERKLEIDASAAAVFAAIVDLKSWPRWSPWLIHEPKAKIDYSDNYQQESGYYEWDGAIVGAGRLTHLAISPNRKIHQKLEFIRPFKSTNQVDWDFAEHGKKTLVSWRMSGSMPFLFRFMVNKMEPMIGRDYELGLALLNGYLNQSAPHPRLRFGGEQLLEKFSYWYIPFTGSRPQLETSRQKNIDALQTLVNDESRLALTLFRRFDPLATQIRAEVAVPLSANPPPADFSRREFQAGRYRQLTLQGGHQFLALAWYALYSHCRMHKIKLDRRRPALEIYQDDPRQVNHSNQLTTELYIPIK